MSIHADGGPPDGRGFHINSFQSAAQRGAGRSWHAIQHRRCVTSWFASGMQPSTYRGTDGLYGRADLAGLNLARYPSVLIELGNMKNTAEAAGSGQR